MLQGVNMLKKLSVLCVVLCASTAMYAQKSPAKNSTEIFSKSPATASTPAARAGLERRVQESITTPKTSHTSQSQQREIIQALQKANLPREETYDPVLKWSQFLSDNQKEVARVEARLESLQPALDAQEEILKNAPVSKGYKRPDYGAYAQQVPFIYVTDASAHGIKTIINEVKQVLRSVRRANPQARILLALEFAEMENGTPPVRFAGQENTSMEVYTDYDALVPVAAELDIDILALEDGFIDFTDSAFFYKIGKHFIKLSNNDHPDFASHLPDPTQPENILTQEYKQLRGFLCMSTLGMRFRNEQWAGYINAAKPFYDIVIVYAGYAHIDYSLEAWQDVPELVGEKYITFNFIAAEKAPQNQQKFEDTAHEQLDDGHSRYKDPVPALLKRTESKPLYSPNIWRAKTRGNRWIWYGKEFWYLKTTKAETEKYIQSLPADKQRTYRQAQETLRNAGAEKLEFSEFDIYLPNWPKAVQDL